MKATFSRTKIHSRAANPCTSTAFYTSPATGAQIVTSQPLTLSWNTSSAYANCLGNVPKIDIYLTSPSLPDGQIKAFSPINFADGTYTHSLDPKWWNGTQGQNLLLRVNIIPTGTRLFLSPIAAGPLLNVTVDQAVSNSTSATTVDPNLSTGNGSALVGGLPKGSVAAAVLLPILVVMLGVAIYVKISRKKVAEKRKRWSQAMDARMSRLSGDWKAMSAHGASAALRNSEMRMSTVFAQEMQMDMRPSMSSASRMSIAQLNGRPSVETVATRPRASTTGERQSRISFAADVNLSKDRLSSYSTGRASRAFHVGAVPPVPALPRSSSYESRLSSAYVIGSDVEEESAENVYHLQHHMSPTQTEGPIVLSNDDIHNIDIAPALRLMRTGSNPASTSTDDLLLSPPPTAAVATPTLDTKPPLSPLGASSNAPPLSPLGMSMMPIQPHTSPYMSPDDLLRKYAELRAAGAKSPTVPLPVPPSPIYSVSSATPSSTTYTASGMRNLTGNPALNHNAEDGYADSPYAGEGYYVHPYKHAGGGMQ